MIKVSNYVKFGFLVAFAITALVWGLSYLKGHDFFKPVNYYYCRYERVDGLQESSPVTVNGYRVGNVKNIRFTGDQSGDLIVTLMVDHKFRIPAGSVARIVSSDIMGTRSVELVFQPGTIYFTNGDTIAGEIEADLKEQVSLQILPLKYKAEELLSTIDSAMTILTVIFNEDARKNLSESFQNINQTISSLEKTTQDLQELVSQRKTNLGNLITNMESISTTLKDNSVHFDKVIRNLSGLSDTLASMPFKPVVEDLSSSVHTFENLLKKINSDQSSAGLFFNDDALYYQVTGIADQLQLLIDDIKNNPKRYLHFSAVNLGKEVYLNTPEPASDMNDNLLFKVHLISESRQLPLTSPSFLELGPVEEQEYDKGYAYYTGKFRDYDEAEKMLIKARTTFPAAAITAFLDGKKISLEKAFRLLNR